MNLVPAGKTRIMVAQQFSTPSMEGFGGAGIDGQSEGGPLKPAVNALDPTGEPSLPGMESQPSLDTEGATNRGVGAHSRIAAMPSMPVPRRIQPLRSRAPGETV